MNFIEISNLLKSRPHDPHYLNRYIKLIQSKINLIRSLEKHNRNYHHILPKATDLFPEYKSFSENPWNKICLTSREHFLCHLLLWKAYKGSQTYAIFQMATWQGRFVTSRLYEKLRIDYSKMTSDNCKGLAMVKDPSGKIFKVPVGDQRLKSGELVGHCAGTKNAVDSKTGKSLGRIDVNDPRWISGEIITMGIGKVPAACSKTGINLGLVDKNDMRFETGDIICRSAATIGKAAARCTKTFKIIGSISLDDPRWKTGEIQGEKRDCSAALLNNNYIGYIHKSDPRWLSGELKKRPSPRRGKSLAKCAMTGKYLGHIDQFDNRWNNAEVVGNNQIKMIDKNGNVKIVKDSNLQIEYLKSGDWKYKIN